MWTVIAAGVKHKQFNTWSISRFGEGVFDWYGLAIKTIGRRDRSQFSGWTPLQFSLVKTENGNENHYNTTIEIDAAR